MSRSKKVTPNMFPKPKMCGGKHSYHSEADALAMKEQNEAFQPGLELAVYKCNLGCRGWHLTRSIADSTT